MAKPKENPQSASEAEQGAQRSKVEIKDTFSDGCNQELAERPFWLPHGKSKAPQYINALGVFTGIDWEMPEHWMKLDRALAMVAANPGMLTGVGIVIDVTTLNGWRLIAVDVDKVAGALALFSLVNQIPTYWEASPSDTGLHAYALVPEAWAERYKNTGSIKLDGCDHAEIYVGNEPTFITVTGRAINDLPIAQLDEAALAVLGKLARVAGSSQQAAPAPEVEEGERLDLSKFRLTDGQHMLLAGKGQPDIDRSVEWHLLARDFIDQGASQQDVLATLLHEPHVWQALVDHRQGNEARALEFAREEVARAATASGHGVVTQLIELGKQFQKPAVAPPSAPRPSIIPATPISERLRKAKPPTWLIQGMLQMGQLIAFLGEPNSGKTAVTLDLALRVALKMALRARQVEQRRVVYVGAENPEDVVLRIRLWCKTNKVDPRRLDKWFVLIERPVFFDQPEQIETLRAELEAAPPGLIVTDTFNANFGGDDENNAALVMNWMRAAREHLIEPFGCAVIVPHHPPKNSTDPFNWRGSGAAAGTVDGIWAAKNTAGTITVSQGKRRGPPFEDMHWEISTQQIEGMDPDNFGDLATSVMVKPTGKAGVDQRVANICKAIEDGHTSLRAIDEETGIPKTTVGELLKEMKEAKLVFTAKNSRKLCLTMDGKLMASEALPSVTKGFGPILERMAEKANDDD